MDETTGMDARPQALPVVGYRGRLWFVDLRLKEFRATNDPGRRIVFESRCGLYMCVKFGIEPCPFCRGYVMDANQVGTGVTRCWDCGAKLWVGADDADG